MKLKLIMIAALAITSLTALAQPDGRGGHGPGFGGFDRQGPGRGNGEWRRRQGENWDRKDLDLARSYELGQDFIGNGQAFQAFNVNRDVLEIKLCASMDHLRLLELKVLLGDGQILLLSGQTDIARNTCTPWMRIPGKRLNQVLVIGQDTRRPAPASVVILGRDEPPRPRVWGNNNGPSHQCGDGQGPFFTVGPERSRMQVKQCPRTNFDGGPIGMPCETPGELCYGWSQPYSGPCYAPNGVNYPQFPMNYSVYQCQQQ